MKEVHEIMRSNILDVNLYVVKERLTGENSPWIYHGKIIIKNKENAFFYDENDEYLECFTIKSPTGTKVQFLKKLLKYHEIAVKSKMLRSKK